MLKGLRFQKRISILPGVRINLSKSGVSASVGPRGADVNIGSHGVTTNAGIPGTGLSYRQKVGGGKTWLAVLAVIGGLGVWGFQHLTKIEKFLAPTAQQVTSQPVAGAVQSPVNITVPGLRYVHRGGSVIRDEPKASGRSLKKESKGSQVTLISQVDGWAKVSDGAITGWMRASVLGTEPPQ
ncbi:MAG: hypothetical protein JWN16_1194 [Alphaproteobacteria bacterium]|nr:hypothetical protein [Alphaproteobacteria bacterium]